MPWVTAPNIIEQTDFSGGYAPDSDATGTDSNILPDMLNLLPDSTSDALVTRKGFKRVMEELSGTGTTTHYVKHIYPFQGNGEKYLICILSTDASGANNIKVYAITLSAMTAARIDTEGTEWSNPDRPHWGLGINEIYYGGSPGNGVYSWDPSTGTWDAAANVNSNWDTLVDSMAPGANEVARDFAFKGKEKVVYDGDIFTPARDIRFAKWESADAYEKGERVSHRVDIGGETYWRSYRCIQKHDSNKEPGIDADWRDYWQKIRLPLPRNDDGETSSKWYFVPVAPGTSVAAWHADRIWMRYDGMGDQSRLLYSAPVHPEKGEDVPDIVFNMYDFAPGNDIRGPGGGWLEFNDGAHDGVIEALWSYGMYLIVFKRQGTYVLTGNSEDTFTRRRLSRHIGCVSPNAVVELNSLVYFLSDDGLYVTDGTAIEPVNGMDKVRSTLVARLDAMHAEGAAGNLREAALWTWENMVWFSLACDSESEEEVTWVYDPKNEAFYKTNLPVLAACTTRSEGVRKFFFSVPGFYSTRDYVYQYDHPNSTVADFDVDDDGANSYAGVNIAWNMKVAWWPFSVLREQRRIRRIWAVVKGAMTYTLKTYTDWDASTEVSSEARTVSQDDYPVHIEGEWIPDCHSLQMKLSSTKAPASVYGLAVDTQPRRVRYHTD